MKLTRRIILTAILLLPALNIWGQDRDICGVVVSAGDKSRGLESVNVMLMDEALSTSQIVIVLPNDNEAIHFQ